MAHIFGSFEGKIFHFQEVESINFNRKTKHATFAWGIKVFQNKSFAFLQAREFSYFWLLAETLFHNPQTSLIFFTFGYLQSIISEVNATRSGAFSFPT